MTARRPRPAWQTVPLYLVGVAVIAVDVWGVIFWARVGGRLGIATAAVGLVVALVLTAVLIADVRRQRARRSEEDTLQS